LFEGLEAANEVGRHFAAALHYYARSEAHADHDQKEEGVWERGMIGGVKEKKRSSE